MQKVITRLHLRRTNIKLQLVGDQILITIMAHFVGAQERNDQETSQKIQAQIVIPIIKRIMT